MKQLFNQGLPKKEAPKHRALTLLTLWLSESFESCDEPTLNQKLKEVVSDFPLVRRALVDYGYVNRDDYGKEYTINHKLITRLANMADLSEIKSMIVDVVKKLNKTNVPIWNEVYPNDFLEAEIESKRLYVVEFRETILGCFALNPVNRGSEGVNWKHSGKAVYLDKFAVRADYQQFGLGQKIIEAALNISSDLGYDFLRLFVVDYNTPALNFYRKLGFSEAEGIFEDQLLDRTLSEFGFERKTTQ